MFTNRSYDEEKIYWVRVFITFITKWAYVLICYQETTPSLTYNNLLYLCINVLLFVFYCTQSQLGSAVFVYICLISNKTILAPLDL